jgi:hypothetical protein
MNRLCLVCGGSTTHDLRAPPALNGIGSRVDPATGHLHCGAGAARVSQPGMTPERAIGSEADVPGENDRLAMAIRAHFATHGVAALSGLVAICAAEAADGLLDAMRVHLLAVRRTQRQVDVG